MADKVVHETTAIFLPFDGGIKRVCGLYREGFGGEEFCWVLYSVRLLFLGGGVW
jgi:hypothetical protein